MWVKEHLLVELMQNIIIINNNNFDKRRTKFRNNNSNVWIYPQFDGKALASRLRLINKLVMQCCRFFLGSGYGSVV